jgi:hypothetical protein
MDQKQFIKQMLDFQKTTFDNSFNAMMQLQAQTEKASNTLLDQMTWLPNDSRKANDQWVAAYKKGCKDFKALVDENFSKAEAFFVGGASILKTKTKKADIQKEATSKKSN